MTKLKFCGFGLINPKLRVPVLSIDDEMFTEVPAILTVLVHLASPDRKVLGKTLIETGRAAPESIKAKGILNVIAASAFIESRLGGLHGVGDAFTVVDLYLLVFYRWAFYIGLEMEKDYPKYTALVANLVKRDAVVKTLEEMKLPPVFAPRV
ncbi:hypothetical protein EMCG_03827 [[Emmonsia] crescens]|uniref:GST C-terminal domain-containing protein n=1 Tax=[Emmonsia] crescens TaxID=73230 RepID=A0A0G2HU00_9EURO|nr:hypothetical protein EMCG_03827 [Emmonsia crescens UAMH 3008]